MELKDSSKKRGGLYPHARVNDLEEKEVSDDEDDDRNHKHRRRGTRSESLEQVLSKTNRNHKKPFDNGHLLRENESQASERWKNYNISPLEKGFSGNFDRRRLGLSTYPRSSPSTGRGRGRDPNFWSQHNSRFGSVDIASQMVQQGSIPPSLYPGRGGLSNVSNAQIGSWGAFGFIPGIPSGGLDTLHTGMQGTVGPPINPSLNMGITRKRCRDFEERGFCLRGDMCPMEHGVNRIIVDDVQSLSQFNLPVSLPSCQLLGTPVGPGSLSTGSSPATILMNSKGFHVKNNKSIDDNLRLNGSISCPVATTATDLYDPDQPLWNNVDPETSNTVLGLPSPRNHVSSETLLENEPSVRHDVELCDVDNESQGGTRPGDDLQKTSLSVWGRINSKDEEMKGKLDSIASLSDHLENETREDWEVLVTAPIVAPKSRRIGTDDAGPSAMDSSGKMQINSTSDVRRRSQKAMRTLFVTGIPQKNNTSEALLSHFQKFGKVIDIYIPSNSVRAFVQFSSREEAMAALEAPDAVMGNRFIKLWWANRDRIPEDGTITGSSTTFPGVTAASLPPPHPSITYKGKGTSFSGVLKTSKAHAPVILAPASNNTKPVITNPPKVPPPLHKQLEELRQKQELLDQKRNEFRRVLEEKLKKQAAGLKGEVLTTEQAAKRPKLGAATDVVKSASLQSIDPGATDTEGSPHVDMMVDKAESADYAVSHSRKANADKMQSTKLEKSLHSSSSIGAPFLINRYKLDNRPTAFKICPPLPAGFANVSILKEHFSQYGKLSAVECKDLEANDCGDESETSKNCSIILNFVDRGSAEWAYVNGKCWEGHNLQFMWLTSCNSSNDLCGKDKIYSDPKYTKDNHTEKLGSDSSLEAAALGNEGTDHLKRKHNNVNTEQHQQTAASTSKDKESPEGVAS